MKTGNIFALSLCFSLLCHLSLFLIIKPPVLQTDETGFLTNVKLLSTNKTDNTKISSETETKIDILPTDNTIKIFRPSSLKSDQYYKDQVGPYSDDAICDGKDKNYMGVGMIIQPGSNRVTNAPEQYPAYKAGIRQGDIIIDPYGPTEVDGHIIFEVKRGSSNIRIQIKVEKICYNE